MDGNYICIISYFHYSNYPYNRRSTSLFSWQFAREVLFQNANNLYIPSLTADSKPQLCNITDVQYFCSMGSYYFKVIVTHMEELRMK